MDECIILPFDGSPPARIALRRAVEAAQAGTAGYSHVLVATVGVERTTVVRLLKAAHKRGGLLVPFEVRFLDSVDPIGAWYDLLGSMPEATVAAPVGAKGTAPWYAEACRPGALPHKMMLFLLREQDVQRLANQIRHQAGLPEASHGGLLARLRRLRGGHDHRPADARPASSSVTPILPVARGGDRLP